jgi:NRPS condensation-like uncharacterized protein
MTSAALNVLDELYLHLNRPEEPWSVHLEIRVAGQIERDRLEAAVHEAARRHPLARARLAPARATDVRYRWEIADELSAVDLVEVTGADDTELDAARAELLSRTPDLDTPGPFAVLLFHSSSGDVIVLNLHHAAGDGLSALRLMGSIARAYGGADDPVPDVDPLAVRDIDALSTADSVRERVGRGRAALGYLGRGVDSPTRIVGHGGSERPGYGFALTSFSREEVTRLTEAREDGATLNDVLLAGLAVTIRRWNERHDDSGGDSIYLMMPINLRPPEWRLEIVGNYASYVSVRIGGRHQGSLRQAVAGAAESTRRVKDGAVAGLIVELFTAPTLLPTGLKQRMQSLIPLTGNVVVDTAVLSNLGRVTEVPVLGDAGPVQELYFSPPGRMPLGASLGAATLGDRLFVTLRYRHPLFDAIAAEEFVDLFRQVLLDW